MFICENQRQIECPCVDLPEQTGDIQLKLGSRDDGKLFGLYYFEATEWSPSDANITIYCDASLSRLGFHCPERTVGFHADIADTAPTRTIFYNEALSVLSALMCVWMQSPHLGSSQSTQIR